MNGPKNIQEFVVTKVIEYLEKNNDKLKKLEYSLSRIYGDLYHENNYTCIACDNKIVHLYILDKEYNVFCSNAECITDDKFKI